MDGIDIVSYLMGKAAGGGGGGGGGAGLVADSLLYTLSLSDGGRWITTDLTLTGIDYLLFFNKDNGVYTGECGAVSVYLIPRNSSYIEVITNDGKHFNITMNSGVLGVSFSEPGDARYATDIFAAHGVPPT